MEMLVETETVLELEHQILERLAGRVQRLRLSRLDGQLILEGTAKSYHAKQLATHAALDLAPHLEFVNEIQVHR